MVKRKEETYDHVVAFIAKELKRKNHEIDIHVTLEKVGINSTNKFSMIEKISKHFSIARNLIHVKYSEKIIDFIDYIHHLRDK